MNKSYISEEELTSYIAGNKNNIINNSKIISDNTFSSVIELSIDINPEIIGPNIRYELIKEFKKKYESKVFYLLYIIKINTEPLEDKVLPLLSESMIFKSNLEVLFYTIQKNSIIELSILVIRNNNVMEVKGQNEYINCRILPSSNYSINQTLDNKFEIIIKNKTITKLIENDKYFVKIININSSNDCQTSFIICEGEFVIN